MPYKPSLADHNRQVLPGAHAVHRQLNRLIAGRHVRRHYVELIQTDAAPTIPANVTFAAAPPIRNS